MSEIAQFHDDDSWQFQVQLHAIHVMSYVAGVFGFFIFGLILFVAPVLILDNFATSIPFDTSFEDLMIVNIVGSFLLGIVWRNSYKIQNFWLFASLRKLSYVTRTVSNVDDKIQRLDDALSEFHKFKSKIDFFSSYLLATSQENPELHKQIMKKMGLSSYDEKHFHKVNEIMMNMQNDVDELKSFVKNQKESSSYSFDSIALNHDHLKPNNDYDGLKNQVESLETRLEKAEKLIGEYRDLLKNESDTHSFLNDSKYLDDSEKFLPEDD